MDNVRLKTESGDLQFSFHGTGGKLFGIYLVGILLTVLTVGIYGAWFIVKLITFFEENTSVTGSDGTRYSFSFKGTGGALFGTVFVGYLLTAITMGIYGAWFMVNISRFVCRHTRVMTGDTEIGSFAFVGEGAELFGTYLIGVILTSITLGIYASWFTVNLMKYFVSHVDASVLEKSYTGQFTGTGGQLFVINLVGTLLTVVTLGIYGAWYLCREMAFQYNNTYVLDKG